MASLVSVIIPCFNYGRFLSEAIESIMTQTYREWEIIIVDDGSTDNTGEVAASYTSQNERIRYQYQKSAGVSAARNVGLALAKGEYIQFLDADDYIAPTKFEKQLAQLARHADAGLVYGDTYSFKHQLFDTNNLESERPFTKLVVSRPPISGQYTELALYMAYDNIFLISCPLLKKTMATEIGPFDQTLVSFEDWQYWYRGVLKGKKFVYDNESGTEFYVRSHGSNTSSNRYKMWRSKLQARQSLLTLMQQMQQAAGGLDLDLARIMAAHYSLDYQDRARFELLYGNIYEGIYYMIRYFTKGSQTNHIWYDSAYWLKERLFGRNKRPT